MEDYLMEDNFEEFERGLLSDVNSVDDDELNIIDIEPHDPGVVERGAPKPVKIVNNKVLKYLGTVKVTTDFTKPNPRAWLLQSMLKELGHPLNPDGKFGKMTEEQVKKFQADNDLGADGIVGPATWTRLIYLGRNRLSNSTISFQDYVDAANKLGVEVEVVQAIKDVESSGSGYVFSNHPKILFEGHVFWKQLEKLGITPSKYRDSDILYSKWTKEHYKGDVAEHVRLEKARQINSAAAEASASWGLFQIMGSNYKACGCDNISDFVKRMRESEREQLMLFVDFIKYHNMDQSLKPGNIRWAEFAKRYNGAGYKQNQYDTKLEQRYLHYKKIDKNK